MTVIGPIPQNDWNTLLAIKYSVEQMTSLDPVKYDKSIRKERRIFKKTLAEFYNEEVA